MPVPLGSHRVLRPIIQAGTVFGRLTAIREQKQRNKNGAKMCLCRCECGTVKAIQTHVLFNGHAHSCGCFRREFISAIKTTHGHATGGIRTRTYQAWKNMRRRCFNPNATQFKWYGGRGITCCAQWRFYEQFLADMGECPDGYELDRIDTNGNYEPGNCRWVSHRENMQNTRKAAKYRQVSA